MTLLINYNGVDFGYLLSVNSYLPTIISAVAFTTLFMFTYYWLLPAIVHPYYPHIRENKLLHWKIVDALVSMWHSCQLLLLAVLFSRDTFNNIFTLSATHDLVYEPLSDAKRIILSISLGYFIYDTIVSCIIFSKKHTGKIHQMYVFHHAVTILALLANLIIKHGGLAGMLTIIINEMTNPLLHINAIRGTLTDRSQPISKQKRLIELILKVLYIVLFCVARFIFFTYFSFQFLFVLECNILIKAFVIGLLLLSIVLLQSLFRNAKKVYAKYKEANDIIYESVAMEDTTDNPDEINRKQDYVYEEILSLSKKSVTHFFLSGVVYSFGHISRMAVYLLYLEEFEHTKTQMVLLLYGYNFWCGICSLLYGALANKYGYDLMVTLLMILQCIAVFLESIATSYYMLLTGILLAQVSLTYVVLGYIAWILPHNMATKYTSYFYASFATAYLAGPLLSGFVSLYVSNRTIFIFNFVLCVLTSIHALICIFKTQNVLELKQLSLQTMHMNADQNHQFPICLQMKKGSTSTATAERADAWYSLPQMTKYEWFMLLSILFINSTVAVLEQSFAVFYSLFIIQDVGGNVLIASIGMCLTTLSFIVGNSIVPFWFKSQTNSNSNRRFTQLLKNKYVVLILCIQLLMVHMFLLSCTKSWRICLLLNSTLGVPLGIFCMLSETILLEIQPTRHSGRINGMKGLLRNWLLAVSFVAISMYLDVSHNAFLYVVAIALSTSMTFAFSMMVAKYKHTE